MTPEQIRERVGCTFVIFRGAISGRIITCGICDWCRSPAFDALKAELETSEP